MTEQHDEHSTPTPPPPANPSTPETVAPEGDTRDWAKDDQEAVEGLRGAFGTPDSEEGQEGAQEAAEGREEAVKVNLAWALAEDGTPQVRLNEGLPAQGYLLDDMERFRDNLSSAIVTAQRMAALWEWLADNGVEEELRRKLVMDAFRRSSEEAAKESLLSLAFGGMFSRAW